MKKNLFLSGRVGSSTPDKGVPDMTCIPDIDENGINRNLKVRYDRDEIYVSIQGYLFSKKNMYKCQIINIRVFILDIY